MAYEGWATVELMGFVKTVGRISEEEAYGTKLLRCDRPVMLDAERIAHDEDGQEVWITTFHGGSSIYRLTPTEESLAKMAAYRAGDPRPVHRLAPRLEAPAEPQREFPDVDDEFEEPF